MIQVYYANLFILEKYAKNSIEFDEKDSDDEAPEELPVLSKRRKKFEPVETEENKPSSSTKKVHFELDAKDDDDDQTVSGKN